MLGLLCGHEQAVEIRKANELAFISMGCFSHFIRCFDHPKLPFDTFQHYGMPMGSDVTLEKLNKPLACTSLTPSSTPQSQCLDALSALVQAAVIP